MFTPRTAFALIAALTVAAGCRHNCHCRPAPPPCACATAALPAKPPG